MANLHDVAMGQTGSAGVDSKVGSQLSWACGNRRSTEILNRMIPSVIMQQSVLQIKGKKDAIKSIRY